MFKLIALAILIYIIYKIVTYVKESKEFEEKYRKEEFAKMDRIDKIPEKNRICANCRYALLDKEYYELYPNIIWCQEFDRTKEGRCKCNYFDPRQGIIFDADDICNHDLSLQELNAKYKLGRKF